MKKGLLIVLMIISTLCFAEEVSIGDRLTISTKQNGIFVTREITGIYPFSNMSNYDYCIQRSKKDIGALKKGQVAGKRGQFENWQI